MLNKENIKDHINLARPLFARVQKLYCRLPETLCQCDTPGRCCMTMPEMTVVEALQWLDVVIRMSPDTKIEILQKLLAFYLSTPLLRPGCPFLLNHGCTNYSFRTFACRAYGLWSVNVGKKRTTENRHNKREIIKAWQQMGVNLPVEKVMYEMDYCDQVVQKKAQTPVTKISLQSNFRFILRQFPDKLFLSSVCSYLSLVSFRIPT
jgi:Fe-S-cluster containining protein